MSKIYEALQRAEQERLATEPAAPRPVTALPTSSVQDAAPIVSWAPQSGPEIPGSFHLLDDPTPSYSQPALDLSAVPLTSWSPLFDKLPALEERGGSVEQFRSLRTRLSAFRDVNKLKSILITSGLPREGKSFVAANLAISFARHKSSRVLLIDGDMRRSSLHTVLGCSKSPGLTSFLAGEAGIVEIMQRARVNQNGSPLSAGLGSLTFIAGGEGGDKAADLSGSPRFQQLIECVSPSFDWIIVDSSPVNLVADGVNLARSCDGVLMIARGGVTKFEAAQRALAELKGSKVLGVVLNAIETPPGTDGYYGYDSYDSIEPAAGPATT